MKKETLIKIAILLLIVAIFAVTNVLISSRNKTIEGEYNGTSELLSTIDCVDIFNNNPTSIYRISFDMRTDIDGDVRIMLYDKEGGRYWFSAKWVNSTSEFNHYTIETKVAMVDEEGMVSHLFFDGGYGSGVIPHVKNIFVEEIGS
ncbi:MAG: hypothetical protein MJZ34_14065 [Paludibacteraceae bacterium]|nr:hypothetical protein [Paludibacteraceae bacterium]